MESEAGDHRNGHGLEINRQFIALDFFGAFEKLIHLLGWQRDKHDAIVEGVRIEDVGKTRSNNNPKAYPNRPGSMFAN